MLMSTLVSSIAKSSRLGTLNMPIGVGKPTSSRHPAKNLSHVYEARNPKASVCKKGSTQTTCQQLPWQVAKEMDPSMDGDVIRVPIICLKPDS